MDNNLNGCALTTGRGLMKRFVHADVMKMNPIDRAERLNSAAMKDDYKSSLVLHVQNRQHLVRSSLSSLFSPEYLARYRYILFFIVSSDSDSESSLAKNSLSVIRVGDRARRPGITSRQNPIVSRSSSCVKHACPCFSLRS